MNEHDGRIERVWLTSALCAAHEELDQARLRKLRVLNTAGSQENARLRGDAIDVGRCRLSRGDWPKAS